MLKKTTLSLTATVSVLCAVLLAGEAMAGGAKIQKADGPSPGKVLRESVKKFVKANSYRVKAEIVGGFSDREDHKVTDGKVKEAYEAEVYGKLMHLPKEKAFRTGKTGAAYVDGAWRYIQSNLKTVRFQRLFPYPRVLLGRALASSRTARWVQHKKAPVNLLEGGDDGKVDKKKSKKKKKKKRKIKKKKKSSSATVVEKDTVAKKAETKTDPNAFRFLRVDAPPKEALRHFIEVQNSHCFGVG